MAKQPSLLNRFYNSIILDHPVLVVVFLVVVVSFLGYNAKNFKLDASAETLVLENDEDLRYSRVIDARYGNHDYLIIAIAF
jgi:predicted RND superfamily exporter protein